MCLFVSIDFFIPTRARFPCSHFAINLSCQLLRKVWKRVRTIYRLHSLDPSKIKLFCPGSSTIYKQYLNTHSETEKTELWREMRERNNKWKKEHIYLPKNGTIQLDSNIGCYGRPQLLLVQAELDFLNSGFLSTKSAKVLPYFVFQLCWSRKNASFSTKSEWRNFLQRIFWNYWF